MKVCVIIPAYNEASTLERIIMELKAKGLDVLVIDDGSSDETGRIALNAGAMLITHKSNIGKGASMKKGFDFAMKNPGYEAVVVMDGDGQHKVEDIDRFLKKAKDNGADIIVGNRMGHTRNMPYVRLCTNKFMSGIISSLCKQRIPDTQCGFRLLKRKVLETVDFISKNYDTESEMLINASRQGFRISSVPVKTVYRGERSDISPLKDTMRFMALLFRSYFQRRRRKKG